MTIQDLIAHFHASAEGAVVAHPSAEDGRAEVADALFTVAVAHKLRNDGPAALLAELSRLAALVEPMRATDAAVELFSADPSLLLPIKH